MQSKRSWTLGLPWTICISFLFWTAHSFSAATAPQATTAPAPQKPGPTPATQAASNAPDYSQQAYVVLNYDTQYKFRADGTGEQVLTVAVRVQSQAGIQRFGNLAIPYEAASQRAEFPYVRVRKPDGSLVNASRANMQDTAAPITVQAPMYSDVRIKQFPVSGLNPGDTLEYQLRVIRTRAEVPNQFWVVQNFVKTGIVLEESVSLRFPRGKHVQVASAEVQPTVREEKGDTVYEWKTAHLQDESTDSKSKTDPGKSKPSIQATTFESWQQIGDWYKSLALDRAAVTPAIQQQEQQLTSGMTTDDARQRAIYSYVATQFRYIGLSFGIGRLQPHTADQVLADKFGDCKDKHTLFAALMKAAGYDVWPALIGTTTRLDASVPYPQFDHVISVVPQGKNLLWLDTTEEVAPFGMLAPTLRDKQALVMPTTGPPEIEKTPMDPPFPEADTFAVKGALDSKSVLTGHVDLTARGDLELGLRAAFHAVPQADWTKLAQRVSYALGFAGDVSQVQAGNPDDTSKPFHLSYDYKRTDFGGSAGNQLSPPMPPIMFALGVNDAKPQDHIPLGAPGERDFRASVALPKGDIANLSQDKDIQTDFAEYKEISSVKDGVLLTERNFKIKTAQLPAAQWDDYLKFVKAVQDRENLMIPISTGNGTAEATAIRDSPEARALLEQAFAAIHQSRLNDAEDELRQAQVLNPTQWGLAATYGDLYFWEHDPERAIASYRQEMANHPDNLRAGRALAATLMAQKQFPQAIDEWKSLLQRDPEDSASNMALGTLLVQQKRYGEAVTLLKKVADSKNGTTNLKIELGDAELKAGQKQAGIAELQNALKAATKPVDINDAAYELANTGADLPEAAQSAAKALQAMEESTAKVSLAGLTVDDLRQVAYIGATWDTVGWIDFELGKYADAERYERAAWLLEQLPDVADHLGQVYQKERKLAQAAHMYRLALVAGPNINAREVRQRLEAVTKKAAGARVPLNARNAVHAAELSKLRAVDIPGLPRKPASAEFLLLFSPHGLEDVQFRSGSDTLQNAAVLIKKATYPSMFPDSGPEKIARRGVLSCSQHTLACQFVLFLPQTTRP